MSFTVVDREIVEDNIASYGNDLQAAVTAIGLTVQTLLVIDSPV
jgi:hypothetical protein